MNNYFSVEVKKCVDEFYKLYLDDNYLSKKKYDNFLDSYKDVFDLIAKFQDSDDDNYKKVLIIAQRGYEMVDFKNKKYIEKSLIEHKDYFDNLFKDVDSNILLDEEQRKAILIDEDYSLIIAGAGSGKTTTMAAKVKYLIEKKKIDPATIILLSFTNKATEELNHILNDIFKLNVEVLTFHKLGMKFIRNITNYPVQIVGDKGIYAILTEYFTNFVFKDKILLKRYLECFGKFLKLSDFCFDFDNYDEYYNYYMDVKYEQNQNNLSNYINERIKSRLRYMKTINGEQVESEGEYRIANFLYSKGINYSYEKQYFRGLTGNRSYKPDFTIYDLDRIIYLEYFGFAKLNNDNSIESDGETYKSYIYAKRETHKSNNTEMIELFGRYESGQQYLSKLFFEIIDRNIIMHERTDKEIFYRLLETSKDFPYMNLIRFFVTFIGLYKELNYTENDFNKLKEQTENKEIKEQLDLLKDVFAFYQQKLRENNQIDFQDMIRYAYNQMSLIKENKEFINYDYVIIDEYQDISMQRYNFTKKISDLFDSKIVAVGDDWQTIFSFSGSDIQLFTRFCELMGYAEIVKITKTYRNSQELIDLAGEFVSKNKEQILKELKSDKHLIKPVELIEYDYNPEKNSLYIELDKLINKIHKENPAQRILLLVRFNQELYDLIESKLFYKKSKLTDQIVCKSCPNAKIDLLSIHKSKGLGYDQVIMLNAVNDVNGFPSQIKDEPIIKLLKGTNNSMDEITEMIEYPEERRLFYVAMTRTKNKLYIMTPSNFQDRSDFVKEIQNNEHVLIN